MSPDWLPAPIDFAGGSIADDYRKLNKVYLESIAEAGLVIDGTAVIVDRHPDRIMPEYEAGLMHLVTRSDATGLRTIDYVRASKLNWVAPIIHNYSAPEVCGFWRQAAKGETLYLWLADYDYAVVLRWTNRSHSRKIIVTAYSIDSYHRRDFARYYEQSSRKL